MRPEISAFISTLNDVVGSVAADIPDVWMGAGQFDNCPDRAASMAGDVGIVNRQSSIDMSTSAGADAMAAALTTIQETSGGGTNEPYGLAAWLFATGDATRLEDPDAPGTYFVTPPDCATGTRGFGCVREDSLPILVMIGDEPFMQGNTCTGTATPAEVSAALVEMGAKLVVLSRPSNATSNMIWDEVLTATASVGAVGPDGEVGPLRFDLTGSSDAAPELGNDLQNALGALAGSVQQSVTTRLRDVADTDGGPEVDARVFIERVIVSDLDNLPATDPRDTMRICERSFIEGLIDSGLTEDTNDDTFADTYRGVPASTPVCFDLVVAQNDTVEPADEPRIFKAEIDVVAGRSVLDRRTVYFLVPPAIPRLEGPE